MENDSALVFGDGILLGYRLFLNIQNNMMSFSYNIEEYKVG